MSEPISLLKQQPVPEIVETLERLLASAKSGELTGLAYATERRGNFGGSAWTCCQNIHVMKSAVMTLYTRICLREVLEGI
ncbi:MAG: hypothetical protein R3D70_05780 [Rhizobiaceae bacterium]